ncbi:MAG: phenylacetate--CoA ligase family protein, partial [Thermoleophilia bacterium]
MSPAPTRERLTVDEAGGFLWEPAAERLPTRELGELQMVRLRATLQLAHDRVPFYRRRLDEAGIAPDEVDCHGRAQDLPFTTKIDLRDHYPFGMLALAREEVVTVHCSSGTTGNPVVVGYSRADLALWAALIARTLAAGGVGPGDMLQNAFGYGLFTGGLGLHHGGELLGCTVLPISGGNTERQLKLMRDFGATA